MNGTRRRSGRVFAICANEKIGTIRAIKFEKAVLTIINKNRNDGRFQDDYAWYEYPTDPEYISSACMSGIRLCRREFNESIPWEPSL